MVAITVVASIVLGSSSGAARGLPQLHTQGNQILDDRGQHVTLRGVNTACMEWSPDGEGHLLDTLQVAIKDWHANIIRLPLSEDRWFGKRRRNRRTTGGRIANW